MDKKTFAGRHSSPPGGLVAIVGPTSVGKTECSLLAAEYVDGEIVSADSRLVYRGMDIGTAKPTQADLARVPHHLIDILDPDKTLTLAEYQRQAVRAIEGIFNRDRTPFLVGGSGQYVHAILEGWVIPEVPPNLELRRELEEVADQHGVVALHSRLEELDPVSAGRIDARNVRRVVRALEVAISTGKPISQMQKKEPLPYRILKIGLIRPRHSLYARIDARIDQMMECGFVEEVRNLVKAGYTSDLPAMSALGYRQVCEYLEGRLTLSGAICRIRRETRRLVRQQSNWFRLDDLGVRWFDLDEVGMEEVCVFVGCFVGGVVMGE